MPWKCPRSSSTSTVACSELVLRVTMQLCSLRSVAGPCSVCLVGCRPASGRSRRRHRQLHVPAGFADDAIRAVLPSVSDRPMVDVWCPAWTRQLACPLVCNFLGCRWKTAEFQQLHSIDEVGFTCLSLCNDRCFGPGSAYLLGSISSRSRWADGLVLWGRVHMYTAGGSFPQGHGPHN